MKKKIKSDSKLFNTEVKFTLDETMDSTPSKFALRKLAEANEYFSKVTNLDEKLKRLFDGSSYK